MNYVPPIQDMMFVLNHLAGLSGVNQLPAFSEATEETVEAILSENGKFAREVLAPLNSVGDQQGARCLNGQVTTAQGFKDAFHAFTQAGWQGLQHPPEFGGQGLPKLVAAPCLEMIDAANLSFSLCPLLTDGAIEALLVAGSETLQQRFIPNLISGVWTGTMNLTEPQAGSDLSQIRTKAMPQPDGTYRVSGQKIFITYGEHDLAENIIHLVLARTPNAPEGIKGLSLFVVPKYVVHDDGTLGARNDVWCASLEHKLGIHASPTAVMLYGEGHGDVGSGGALAYLVGEEHKGLQYMFVMMNAARFQVGLQGVGLSERAYQAAVSYAKQRVQSRSVSGEALGAVPIVQHPDVRRMLMHMRAHVEAARALAYTAAASFDVSHHHADLTVREHHQALYEYLVPLVKGWCTEMSVDVASLAVQVYGGMGFIEETGVAQFYRDARILPIYEGTTAIQANDLVGRKTVRDQGRVVKALCSDIRDTVAVLLKAETEHAQPVARHLEAARLSLLEAVEWVCQNAQSKPSAVYAGAALYLKLSAITVSGWHMARALLVSDECLKTQAENSFYVNKIFTVRFFAEHCLSQVPQWVAQMKQESELLTQPPVSVWCDC